MLASELIKNLQEGIERHGDVPVGYYNGEEGFENIDYVYSETNVSSHEKYMRVE